MNLTQDQKEFLLGMLDYAEEQMDMAETLEYLSDLMALKEFVKQLETKEVEDADCQFCGDSGNIGLDENGDSLGDCLYCRPQFRDAKFEDEND